MCRATRLGLRNGVFVVLLIGLIIAGILVVHANAQVPVWTQHNDNARTGQNVNETILTPANVGQLQRLFSQAVVGQIYAQPLYLPGVTIPGQGTHNVVYVATEHDSVYAFDADTPGAALWYVSFINPAVGITTVTPSDVNGANLITPEMGITSTPVIDTQSGTLYVVANTKENGANIYRLHALDIASGAEKFTGPVLIQASVPGTGAASVNGVITFNGTQHLQRPGLLLMNGVLYLGFGSHQDINPYHGWVLAYNASTLQRLGIYNTTPNGIQGAIWQSGAGLAGDTLGNVYVATGNGTFDAGLSTVVDVGDSVVKLALSGNSLTMVDYFTPYNQATLDAGDVDLGSGGVLLLPDQPGTFPHLLVEASKQGTIYLLNRDNLGDYTSTGDSQIVQELQNALGQGGEAEFGLPAYWNNNVYFWGSSDVLKAYQLSNGLLSTSPTSKGSVTSGHERGPTPVVSSSGTSNAIVWALNTDGANSSPAGPAILYAFDANNVANMFYSSNTNASRDAPGPAVKFTVPTVADGRVFVPTGNQLSVYGLPPPPQPDFSLSVLQTQQANPGSPVTLTVNTVAIGGSTSAITLSCTQPASGCFFSPNPVTPGSPSTLTIAANTLGLGANTVTVSGSDGTHTHTASLTVTLGATPPPTADGLAWGDQSAAATTVSASGLTTSTSNELLLAFIASDANTAGMTVSSVTGAGLTWSLVKRANAQLGTSEIWRAFATVPLSNVTITANLAQSVASSITVVSFYGTDTSGTNGSGAIGATASASAASGAPSASLITTRNNSWVFGVGNDWDHATARTAGSNQTLAHQFLASAGDTYWVQQQNSPTPLSGTTVTINDTAPTSDRYNLAIVEVLPSTSTTGTTYSISGTISGPGGSGATVTLTGTSGATTTANTSGSYSFTGLANGPYTITPTNAGFTFTPSSQNQTIAGVSLTAVNFSSAAQTNSISGTISGAGGNGATVTLSGTSAATTTASASGSYSFTGLANGPYTVTPTNTGFTFTPASQPVTVNNGNATANFSTVTYSISGNISGPGGSGATVTLTGTSGATVTADGSGNYSFAGLTNGPYTVAPSHTGFTFTPASQPAPISNGNVTAINFSTVTYSISGNISGTGGSSATVTLSGSASATTSADPSGNYSFSGLVNGNYLVTPSNSGFSFTPTSLNVPINGASMAGVNFNSATATTFSISGTISGSGGNGATVTLSGTATATVTASAAGAYTFSGLSNGPYTVTPSKTGFIFTPASQSLTLAGVSMTAVNFTSTAKLAIDKTVSTDRSSSATTIASPAFTTAAANELLLAFISADAPGSGTNTTVSGVTGGGLSWVLVRRTNTQRGTAEVWRTFAPAVLSNVTVTATLSQSVAASLTVVTFTGADTTGTSGSGALGATNSGSAASGAPTASLTTTRNNSWVFGVGDDWDNAISRTLGANQTLVHAYLATVGDTYWVQRQTGTTPTVGTIVTINDTAPTGDRYDLTIVEVLPSL